MISALLLAAGRSSRMGAFKPLLPFGGGTVIESGIDNLRKSGVNEIIVVVGHRSDELRHHLANLHVRFAENTDHGSEMGVSVACGVVKLAPEVEAVLIALVDQPAIAPEVISLLIGERERTGARLIQPEYEGRGGHPVLIDLSFRNELLSLDPAGGLRALFTAHRDSVLRVPVNSPYIVQDMDTWDDYRALHVEVFGSEPPENS